MSDQNQNKVTPVTENETPVEAEASETPVVETEDKKGPGAPTGTPNDTISAMLPDERVSRSKALNIVRGQDIKCSQERMTIIMADKYGAAPTKEERDAVRAEAATKKKEAADKVKAEKAAERAKVKAEKAEKAKAEKEEKAKIAAETKAKREEAKAATQAKVAGTPGNTPAV